METYDLEVELLLCKAEWKCAMTISGGQYVIISGGPMTLKWHAGSLDSLPMVMKYNVVLDFKPPLSLTLFIFQEQPTTLMPTLVVELDSYSWTMWDVQEEN